MSWAEVKKLNSDLSTPLNLAALINHIDLVGSNYVGYGDVDGTVALLATDAVYAHEVAKNTLANLVKNSNTIAAAVADYAPALKGCLSDTEVWAIISQNSIVTDFCEDKLSASTEVGEWLAFLASSDDSALIGCANIAAIVSSEAALNIVLLSTAALNALFASETASGAILTSEAALNILVPDEVALDALVSSETALSVLVTSDVGLNAIAKSSSACSRFATSLRGITTVSWETDTLWDTMKATLDASSLFAKSGLITDTGGTKTNTGNVITLIQSVFAADGTSNKVGITPAYNGCYYRVYVQNWSTGKHIMWGGHTSTHARSSIYECYVKHYKYTAI